MTQKIRLSALTGLLALALLFVAAPVSAQDNQGGTGDKKSCTGPNGEQYTHGSTYVTYIKVGDKLKTAYTYKCNDGQWEKVAAIVAPPPTNNIAPTSLVEASFRF